MNFRSDEIAQVNERGELFPARVPAEVVVEVRGIVSSEREELLLRARAGVRIADSDADRRMFREVLAPPGRRVIRAGDVAAAWAGRVREAALGAVEGRALAVEEWLRGPEEVTTATRRAIAAEAYLSGMELLDEVRVEFDSPLYLARVAEERRKAALAEEEARERARREAEAERLRSRREEEEARLQARRAEEEARWRAARDQEEARRLAAAKRATEAVREARESGAPLSDVLGRLGAEEGGAMLLSAFASEAQSTLVAAIAGTALIRWRPGKGGGWEHAVEELPGELGPLRSVWGSAGELLVGARDGVWVLEEGRGAVAMRDVAMPAEHGFSAITRTASHVWGAHRQRGLVWWDVGQPGAPAGAIRPVVPPASAAGHRTPPPLPAMGSAGSAGGVGGVGRGGRGGDGGGGGGGATIQRTEVAAAAPPALPGTFSALLRGRSAGTVLAAGAYLEEIDAASGARQSLGPIPSRCLGLAEAEGRVAAICEDGVIRLYDGPELRFAGEIRLGEMLSGAGAWQWSAGTRLLAATRGGALVAAGVTDPVLLRYASAYRGLLEVAGAGNTLAAISPDRMRLVIWNAGEPRRPATEIHVGSIVRGRLADVAVF